MPQKALLNKPNLTHSNSLKTLVENRTIYNLKSFLPLCLTALLTDYLLPGGLRNHSHLPIVADSLSNEH